MSTNEQKNSEVIALHPTKSRLFVPPTPKQLTSSAIQRIGCQSEWKYIIGQWVSCKTYTENLSKYLTDVIPDIDNKKPLLDACIEDGINAWYKSNIKGNQNKDSFVRYMRGTLYRLPEALEWSVSIRNHSIKDDWDPFEVDLSKWWRKHKTLPVTTKRNRPCDSRYYEVNPADYRFIVFIKYLSQGVIKTGNYAPHYDELVLRYG